MITWPSRIAHPNTGCDKQAIFENFQGPVLSQLKARIAS